MRTNLVSVVSSPRWMCMDMLYFYGGLLNMNGPRCTCVWVSGERVWGGGGCLYYLHVKIP